MMNADKASFLATYSDFRLIKGRKVVQFVFELPLEQADMALKVVGGMPNPAAEVWCGIARLDPEKTNELGGPFNSACERECRVADRSALVDPVPPSDKPNRLAQRAGILCNDPLFHRFVEHVTFSKDCNEEDAANWIRKRCGVESRKDILPGSAAGFVFEDILARFTLWRDVPEMAS